MTPEKRPQDPQMDGTGLRFETLDHGGEYPDAMPQAIKLIDAEGRSCICSVSRFERGPMCDKCVELDKKIERYRRVSSSLADQTTIDRIKALIDELQTQKSSFTLSRNRKAIPVGGLYYHVAVGRRGARAHVPTKFDASRGRH
jgi:hypothetical protein